MPAGGSGAVSDALGGSCCTGAAVVPSLCGVTCAIEGKTRQRAKRNKKIRKASRPTTVYTSKLAQSVRGQKALQHAHACISLDGFGGIAPSIRHRCYDGRLERAAPGRLCMTHTALVASTGSCNLLGRMLLLQLVPRP